MEIPVPTDEAQRIRDQVARKVWKGSGVTVLDGPTGDRWTRLVRRHLGDTQTWDGWMQIIAGWENLTPWQIRHLLRHDQCAKVWLECVLASKPKRTRLEREANAADERRRRSLAKIAEMEAQENTTQEAGR
jgi:hypothetical protein